ncbi:MAG: hypothetical protein KGL35_15770 [Bradyrhizobium sp.]|nr:hypothetical protein [Bradyrhizobium sp.]
MILTVSFGLSSVTGFLVTVIGVMRSIIANLASASGRQDHTTSPYGQYHSSRDTAALIASRTQRP